MAGGNFNISVRQVFAAEQKLRIKSVLGLHSARYGSINISHNILDVPFADSKSSTSDKVFGDEFFSILTVGII